MPLTMRSRFFHLAMRRGRNDPARRKNPHPVAIQQNLRLPHRRTVRRLTAFVRFATSIPTASRAHPSAANFATFLHCDAFSTQRIVTPTATTRFPRTSRRATTRPAWLCLRLLARACTKLRHGPVNGLHSVDSAVDTSARFLLTGTIEGVKRHSFFDTFPSFSGWCCVRGSSQVTLTHCANGEGRPVRVYSKALVEENRNERQRQDRVPRRWSGLSGWR